MPAAADAADTIRRRKTVPADPGRVAAIRARIANGFYPLDPQAIAERMIARDFVRSIHATPRAR